MEIVRRPPVEQLFDLKGITKTELLIIKAALESVRFESAIDGDTRYRLCTSLEVDAGIHAFIPGGFRVTPGSVTLRRN